jgi:hypothetical protein
MFEKIFTPNPEAEATEVFRPRKGVIIGMGQVGLACAYSLLIQNCFDELVLQDIDLAKVEGEVTRYSQNSKLSFKSWRRTTTTPICFTIASSFRST